MSAGENAWTSTTDHLPAPTLTGYNLAERGRGESQVVVRDTWSTCRVCRGPLLRIDLFRALDADGDETGSLLGGMPWTHVHPSTSSGEIKPGR